MRKFWLFAGAALLAGCSSGTPSSGPQSGDASTEMAAVTADAGGADAGGAAPVEVTLPQLAYAYKLGFRLAGDRIAGVQEAHRALCDRMGPARCQLLGLTRGSAEDAQGGATLKLRVATADAKGFADAATKSVTDAGGRAIDTNVTAEDVSKQIVDAQARIAQRTLLVERLTAILRNRSGTVAQLVEAERSVADAQEELDKAKAWLAELRGRVAMSDFEIDYDAVAASASPGSTGTQLKEAVSGSGASFLIGMRGLLTILIYLAPWALLAVPVLLVMGYFRRRRAAGEEAPASDQG